MNADRPKNTLFTGFQALVLGETIFSEPGSVPPNYGLPRYTKHEERAARAKSEALRRKQGLQMVKNHDDPEQLWLDGVASEERGERYLTSAGNTAQLAYEHALDCYSRVDELLLQVTGGDTSKGLAAIGIAAKSKNDPELWRLYQLRSDAAYNAGRVCFILATQFSLLGAMQCRLVQAVEWYDISLQLNLWLKNVALLHRTRRNAYLKNKQVWLEIGYNRGVAYEALGDLFSDIGTPIEKLREEKGCMYTLNDLEGDIPEELFPAKRQILAQQRTSLSPAACFLKASISFREEAIAEAHVLLGAAIDSSDILSCRNSRKGTEQDAVLDQDLGINEDVGNDALQEDATSEDDDMDTGSQEGEDSTMSVANSDDGSAVGPSKGFMYTASHVSLETLVEAFEDSLQNELSLAREDPNCVILRPDGHDPWESSLGEDAEAVGYPCNPASLLYDEVKVEKSHDQLGNALRREFLLSLIRHRFVGARSSPEWNSGSHPDYVPHLQLRLGTLYEFQQVLGTLEYGVGRIELYRCSETTHPLNQFEMESLGAGLIKMPEALAQFSIVLTSGLQKYAALAKAAKETQTATEESSQGASNVNRQLQEQIDLLFRLSEFAKDTASGLLRSYGALCVLHQFSGEEVRLGRALKVAWDLSGLASRAYRTLLAEYPATTVSQAARSSIVVAAGSSSEPAQNAAERRKAICEGLTELSLFRLCNCFRSSHIVHSGIDPPVSYPGPDAPRAPFSYKDPEHRLFEERSVLKIRQQLADNARIYSRHTAQAAGLAWILGHPIEQPLPAECGSQQVHKLRSAGGQASSLWDSVCEEVDVITLCVRACWLRKEVPKEAKDSMRRFQEIHEHDAKFPPFVTDEQERAHKQQELAMGKEINTLSWVAWALCNTPAGPAAAQPRRELYAAAFLSQRSRSERKFYERHIWMVGRYMDALIRESNLVTLVEQDEEFFWMKWYQMLRNASKWNPMFP